MTVIIIIICALPYANARTLLCSLRVVRHSFNPLRLTLALSLTRAMASMFSNSSTTKKSKRVRSRSAEPVDTVKKAKHSEPMALFIVFYDGETVGHFVPLRLLPPTDQILKDLEDRKVYTRRFYHAGKKITESEHDALLNNNADGVGDILGGCIQPLAVETLTLSDTQSLKASVQCEFFAILEEEV